ncbi:MAG TPA: hypothetical protein VFM10_04885 [Terriglobales bacterium]|nr:hypothetical protein [Terriglobales bacterium]
MQRRLKRRAFPGKGFHRAAENIASISYGYPDVGIYVGDRNSLNAVALSVSESSHWTLNAASDVWVSVDGFCEFWRHPFCRNGLSSVIWKKIDDNKFWLVNLRYCVSGSGRGEKIYRMG